MSEKLQDAVLVLNRHWCAIDVTTVGTAMCDIFRGSATAIDTSMEGGLRAVDLAEWLTLPIRPATGERPGDKWLGTVHGQVRVPTVIVKSSFADIPKKKPKLDNRGIRQRDGCRCQVTGEYCPDGSVDHLVPISRGGASKSWTNMAWMRKDLNNLKGSRTLKEMGWKLLRKPQEPSQVPVTLLFRRRQDKPDWDHFLVR